MNEYEAQLLAVEQALLVTKQEPERGELQALKESLLELLALTQTTDISSTSANDQLDNEMQRFVSELNELDNNSTTGSSPQRQENDMVQLQALRTKYTAMVGEKCAAPHQHSWGAISYHNAIICGIEDEIEMTPKGVWDVRLRVLYTNPTHREMLPCAYYLEGECRFDAERCHYSHGELVSATSLKDYSAPNFERLARNCAVLAKLKDRIWHRGRVLCVNFMEQQCRVRLDGKEHKERELDFPFEELFPIVNSEDTDLSSCESDTLDIESDSEELDDYEAARRTAIVEQVLFNYKPTQKLGEWEKHTRGIGSKLMAKMGYIHGSGLGSDGRGIVTPVSAQILPPGRSLDACMELREAANGDKDYFSVEKKLQRFQKKQQAINEKTYVRETKRVDVFSFLNDNILAGATSSKSSVGSKPKEPLQDHSTKSLNVASVRLADDIRRKQREITTVQASITRNTRDSQIQKRLQSQLNLKQQELSDLQQQERTLSKEQNARKSKNKMFEF